MKQGNPIAKKIVIAPLDWGLGHATRCIPIIKALQQCGSDVRVASSGRALALLRQEFPTLKFHELASYDIHYADSIPLGWSLFFQIPKLIRRIHREHRQVEDIVGKDEIDIVISDNRYGCWSRRAKNIFITHQINILLPKNLKWAESMLNRINRKAIRKFHHCWVPDQVADRITGSLSEAQGLNVTYIGMLSRFERMHSIRKKYDVLILLSGPEPQRTVMEQAMLLHLKNYSGKVMMVRGLPGESDQLPNLPENISSVNHLTANELNAVIEASGWVVSRSGYSTVMDLAKLGTKAILIPTQGQTEQEYLAEQLMKQKIAFCIDLPNFELTKAMELSSGYTGFKMRWDDSLLTEAVNGIVK